MLPRPKDRGFRLGRRPSSAPRDAELLLHRTACAGSSTACIPVASTGVEHLGSVDISVVCDARAQTVETLLVGKVPQPTQRIFPRTQSLSLLGRGVDSCGGAPLQIVKAYIQTQAGSSGEAASSPPIVAAIGRGFRGGTTGKGHR